MNDKRLISEVSQLRFLYDRSEDDYKDGSKKDAHWKKIAKTLKIPADVAQKRWRDLRDRYVKERKKETQSLNAGGAIYYSKWYLMPYLSFLQGTIKHRDNVSAVLCGKHYYRELDRTTITQERAEDTQNLLLASREKWKIDDEDELPSFIPDIFLGVEHSNKSKIRKKKSSVVKKLKRPEDSQPNENFHTWVLPPTTSSARVPDLSDRMGMDAPPSQGKMEASSNYLTCSPLISAMPGIHEELMHGAGPSSSSHDHFEGESLPGDYEGEEMMEVKQEPVLSMSSEICEDENSQNNTQSSSDRRSTQSSPTPVGMAGPYLLKKETHCSTILDQLLRDDTFSDVTLTAEGQSIRAHKIVLCLASAYFRQVLSKESTVQNVIVFRDIKFSELRNLINFIYTGEATVDASDLESFMKTAEMLEVNSLSDGQRNIPKNFLPRAREMEPDRPPRGPSSSSSKRSSQNAGPGSPPSKSRRTSAEVSPPPRTYKQTFPTTVASGPPVPPLVQFPPPVIKTEPKSEESLEDDFPTQGEEEQEVYDNHDRSPSQPHDPDQSPPLDRLGDPSASEIPPPGKCPFCSGPQPVWRERALTKHLYVCHPDKTVFPCDICSRAFLKESAYETHKDDCR